MSGRGQGETESQKLGQEIITRSGSGSDDTVTWWSDLVSLNGNKIKNTNLALLFNTILGLAMDSQKNVRQKQKKQDVLFYTLFCLVKTWRSTTTTESSTV